MVTIVNKPHVIAALKIDVETRHEATHIIELLWLA